MKKRTDQRKHLIGLSEISLSLDTYDDIFSDFDPRPFHLRALSDDFLTEARKAIRNKPSGAIELRFVIPSHERNVQYENTIRERLRRYFNDQYRHARTALKNTRNKSLLLTTLGICLMFAAAYIRGLPVETLRLQLLFVLFEPAGWFCAWYGLDRLVTLWTTSKPELEFYHKMSRCEIAFSSY